MGKKPVLKEKKLEMPVSGVELTDAFRPKRISVPPGVQLRFGGNATAHRAERILEINRKFRQFGIFNAREALRRCHVRPQKEASRICVVREALTIRLRDD